MEHPIQRLPLPHIRRPVEIAAKAQEAAPGVGRPDDCQPTVARCRAERCLYEELITPCLQCDGHSKFAPWDDEGGEDEKS